MDEDSSEIIHNSHWINYYITSGGRIWGVADENKIEGEAQERRNVLGNVFKTPEEACYAKSQIEAWARLKKYAKAKITFNNNNPVIELEFHIPENERSQYDGDILLLANKYNDGVTHAGAAY